ncbi:MAG: acyl-CoA desaturase [Sphingobacteriales bacterium]|nr:MAG: acyl-CoA desaturase [Sphingobacteriales bacterium]
MNIDQYFDATGLSPNRNRLMVWKTVAMLSIYFVPFIAILAGAYEVHPFLFYMCWFVMGIGVVGIGTSVMHDGNHGAYTGDKSRDKFIGLVIHLVGGNDISWKIQHNILHHTYTNIDGLDDDIDAGTLLRFTPHARKVPMHRYQHLYAWFVYSLMTLYWCTAKDFLAVINYNRIGLLKKERISLRTALLEVALSKILYFSIFLVLPLLLSGAGWTSVVLGFLLMHFVAGLSLACIFQLAHVMEESDFAKPSDDRKMESSWAVHQLQNTVNFAPTNKLLSWFIGGLNFQIEHHLFPHICHVHYPNLSPIVAKTAAEFGLQYQVRPTFRNALKAHAQMLKKLGE